MPAKAIFTLTSWAWGSSISIASVRHGPSFSVIDCRSTFMDPLVLA